MRTEIPPSPSHPNRLHRVLAGVALAAALSLSLGCAPYARNSARTPAATASAACAAGPVTTQSGPACGTGSTVGNRQVEAFRGMPYATAGRWQDPRPYGSWSGTFPATGFGPICPQKTAHTELAQSEDCLSINVWRPQGASKLPVVVFVYGGAFVEGASDFPVLDGSRLAANEKVVVVSFNYRLGALGFLAGTFADGGSLGGNFGFKDQQTALAWVNQNVDDFGGNAKNVTLVGESAGAMSVGLHMLSAPASGRYFQKAVMESNPFALPYKTLAEAAPFGSSLEAVLGCASSTKGLACLKNVPYRTIVDKQLSIWTTWPAIGKGFVDFLVWAPLIDGSTITADPIHGSIDRPTVLGTNLNEGNLFVDKMKQALDKTTISDKEAQKILKAFFGETYTGEILTHFPLPSSGDATPVVEQILGDYLFTCANRWVATHASDPSQVWGYQFRPKTTYDIWNGAAPDCVQKPTGQSPICHGDELPYVFDSWSDLGVTPSADETALTTTVQGYWGSFATQGTPAKAAAWQPVSDQESYLLLLHPPVGQVHPFPICTSFWDTIGYDLRKVPSNLFDLEAPVSVGAPDSGR